MNASPSNIPQLSAATSLSNPGFDILLAVSEARQSALPTVRMMRTQATRERHAEKIGALRDMLLGTASAAESEGVRPARFFDLSDPANALSETVNDLFTRGFQPMLSPADLHPLLSARPIPHDED
ncbi:hypothetical protein [Sphingopyxis sp.]|uniref:hypothetical protein n=1 Tax=Sphingopyxis sp. TaxID=1908224 RepID=UPI0035ADF92B